MNGLFVLLSACASLPTGVAPAVDDLARAASPDRVHSPFRSMSAPGHAIAHRRASGRRTHHHGSVRRHSRTY